MDGLTVTTAKDLLETGKTFSEMRKQRMAPKSDQTAIKSFGDTLTEAVDKVNTLQKPRSKLFTIIIAGVLGTLAFNAVMYTDIAITGIPVDIVTTMGSLAVGESEHADIIGHTIEETLELSYWDITPEKYAKTEEEQPQKQ